MTSACGRRSRSGRLRRVGATHGLHAIGFCARRNRAQLLLGRRRVSNRPARRRAREFLDDRRCELRCADRHESEWNGDGVGVGRRRSLAGRRRAHERRDRRRVDDRCRVGEVAALDRQRFEGHAPEHFVRNDDGTRRRAKDCRQPGNELERRRAPCSRIPRRLWLLQLRHAFRDGSSRRGFEMGREADAVHVAVGAFVAPRDDDEEGLLGHHELDRGSFRRPEGGGRRRLRVAACIRPRQVRNAGSRSKSASCWARPLLRGLGDGSVEAGDARRVGLGQAALARELRVQRHQLAGERSLLFALPIRHPAGDVALARRQQHAKIVSAHPLGGLEGRRRVAVFGLQQRQHRERRRRIARDRRGRPDLRDFEQPIDGGDGPRRRDNGLRSLAQPPQRLRLRHLRAPQHVVVRERLGFAAGVAGCGERRVRRAAAGERSRQADLGARGLLDPLEAGERLDGCLVGGDAVLELLLRRLREGQPGDGRSPRTPCRRPRRNCRCSFGTRPRTSVKRLADEIDERQALPRAPRMREMLDRLEMRAAFDERRPRTGPGCRGGSARRRC